MAHRIATVKRKTRETNVSLELNIDGTGKYESDIRIKRREMTKEIIAHRCPKCRSSQTHVLQKPPNTNKLKCYTCGYLAEEKEYKKES